MIRRAVLDDVEDIQSIGLLTWPTTYLPISNPEFVLKNLNTRWSRAAVTSTVVDDLTYVAVHEGEVVGTVTAGQFDGAVAIWKIYVLPAHHGKGFGRRLMDAALADVPADRDVVIEFVQGNERARLFYETVGFTFNRS